jgi:hypothetical protein
MFNCEKCKYTTNTKQHYSKHMNTKKHTEENKNITIFNCEICKKPYKSKKSLLKHNNTTKCQQKNTTKCITTSTVFNNNDDNNNDDNTTIITTTNIQQEEYQNKIQFLTDLVIKLSKNEQVDNIDNIVNELTTNNNMTVSSSVLDPTDNNTTTVINNNNNTKIDIDTANITTTNNNFNINIFLNEKCGDAINFTDFMHSIVIQMDDLKLFAKDGYVESISNIIKKNLKKHDIHTRPIHYYNEHETKNKVHIRDENKWKNKNKDVKTVVNDGIVALDLHVMKQIQNIRTNTDETMDDEMQEIRKHSSIHIENAKEQNTITKNVLREVILHENQINNCCTTYKEKNNDIKN